MDLSFYPLTLEALDQANAQANAEALCLFVGEDERPLVGLAGLCDWRLSGGLSRMLRRGLVKGEEGEALLTPGLRLGFRKLFLFGMGPDGQSEDELAARLGERLRRLGRAGVEDAAFQIPQQIALDLGIRTLIDEPGGPLRARVFGPDPSAMVRALSSAASRGASEARLERRVIKVPSSHNLAPVAPRKGPPLKPGALEIPRASPLPFAPANAKAPPTTASPIATPEKVEPHQPIEARATNPDAPQAGEPSAAGLGPEKLEGEAPQAEPQIDHTPIAPSASEPPGVDVPIAPPADLTPLPPPAASEEAKPPGTKPLPADYKAQRFVPPAPRPDYGGKKKKKR